jgi:hypothetical protein
LVLGVGITALGAVRCLGRRGTPLYAAGTDESLVTRSRWYRPSARRASPRASRKRCALLETLSGDRMV